MHRNLFSALMGLFFALSVLLQAAYAQDTTASPPAQPATEVKKTVLSEGQYPASELEAENEGLLTRAKISTVTTPGRVWEIRGERAPNLRKMDLIGEQNLRSQQLELERILALKAMETDSEFHRQQYENGESSVSVGDQAAPIDAFREGEGGMPPLMMGGYPTMGAATVAGLGDTLRARAALDGGISVATQAPAPAQETTRPAAPRGQRQAPAQQKTPAQLLEESFQ